MATNYLHEAQLAMGRAADYGNSGEPDSMITQTHFASAAALVAIARRLDRLIDCFDRFTDDDNSCIDVAVLQ